MPKTAARDIYQLKVTLRGSKPPIWRRLQVASDTSLYKLHQIIQIAMDWDNSHLHHFIVGETVYDDRASEPDPFGLGMESKDERKAKLGQLLSRPKEKLLYEYDFGDSWEHEILLEKVLPPDEGTRYPVCVGGKRAAPPDDCGGIWGYYEMLDALSDPDHPDHEEYDEWLGAEPFDTETFDLDAINDRLRRL